MGKTIAKIIIPLPARRNPLALEALKRRSSKFKDRRQARGGAKRLDVDYED